MTAGAVLAAAFAVVALRADQPCERRASGWCPGDMFIASGGPIVVDGNGFALPETDRTATPQLLLTPDTPPQPVSFFQYPLMSSRVLVVNGIVECGAMDGTATDGSFVNGAPTCPPDTSPLYEPICLKKPGDFRTDTPGGTVDVGWNVTCPAGSAPVYVLPDPKTANGGKYSLADGHGTLLGASITNPVRSETAACATDPLPVGGTNHVWTTDVTGSHVNEFAGRGQAPIAAIDARIRTFVGSRCGTSASDPYDGCGATEAIAFDSIDGDLFVGTTAGTNAVLRFHRDGTFVREYAVPVPLRMFDAGLGVGFDVERPGISSLSLAADRKTMFYTSRDNAIRVFNVDGAPLAATDLGARLIAKGLHLVDLDGSAWTGDPANARFGLIPIRTRAGAYDPAAVNQIRLLPPGDPLVQIDADHTAGVLVAATRDVGLLDFIQATDVAFAPFSGGFGWTKIPGASGAPTLVASNRYEFVHDLRFPDPYPDLSGFTALDVTPDGASFWTAGTDAASGTPQLLEYHIATRTPLAGPLNAGDARQVPALCIVAAYAPGATQPDCSASAGDPLCRPLPASCPEGSIDPGCVVPGGPSVSAIVPPPDAHEGDPVANLRPIVLDPANLSNATARFIVRPGTLPAGLTMDASGAISGTIDANAALDLPYKVVVTVTNGDPADPAHTWVGSFPWRVLERNVAPALSVSPSALDITVLVGRPMPTITLSATDGDACDALVYVMSGSLPPGIAAAVTSTPSQAVFDRTCIQHVAVGVPYVAQVAGTPTAIGTYTFTIEALDHHECDALRSHVGGDPCAPAESQVRTFTVSVVDRLPPSCAGAHASVEQLWPPNHRLVPIDIVGVTDPNAEAITLRVTRVEQDEPTAGLGDGDTPIDAVVAGPSVLLRAERSASGDGRVYLVSFTATNVDGASCSGTVTVGVPRAPSAGAALDSVSRYDSTDAAGAISADTRKSRR